MGRPATDKLVTGFKTFRRKRFSKERGLYRKLAEKGQEPKTLVISCADSRVSPTAIFAAQPGEIFVTRIIASIVPPHDGSAEARTVGAVLEYAVKVLKVTDIVVLGHAKCGGVHALVAGGHGLDETDYVKSWVEIAAPARQMLPAGFAALDADQRGRVSEEAVVKLSVANLLSYPWIKEKADAGALGVHGWRFDIHEGALSILDRGAGVFDAVR